MKTALKPRGIARADLDCHPHGRQKLSSKRHWNLQFDFTVRHKTVAGAVAGSERCVADLHIKAPFKRKGYGKILLDYSLEKAKELGCGALCFEGNIDFYGKSGFRQASEFGIRYHGLPEGEDASFFLCEELMPGYLNGITGEYAPPAGYLVNEKEAETFDREFPYMEKKKLPGQIF